MYKLVDYWGNGNIEVMSNSEFIADIKSTEDGFVLKFSIKVELADLEAVEQWLNNHIKEMESLLNSIR